MRRAAVVNKKSAAATPKRIKGATVAPDYLIRLMEYVGPTAAADMLGSTASTLHKARRMNLVTPAFEIAARGIWLENNYEEEASAAEAPPAPRLERPAASRTTDMHKVVASPHAEDVTVYMIQIPTKNGRNLERAAEMLGAVIVAMD